MALFDQRVIEEIVALVRKRYLELGQALGIEPVTLDQGSQASVLYGDLRLLVEIANGEHYRSEELVEQVEKALERLMTLLWGNAFQSRIRVPDAFWRTEIGILFSRARWWVSMDDLLTISNAAALAFGENTQANRMRIVRAVENGLLDWLPDPSIANPQQNKRVLRSQIERLYAIAQDQSAD